MMRMSNFTSILPLFESLMMTVSTIISQAVLCLMHLSWTGTNKTYSICSLDVKIGLQSSAYTAQEGDGATPICAGIVDGCLGQDIRVQYSTFDGTAQGMCNA